MRTWCIIYARIRALSECIDIRALPADKSANVVDVDFSYLCIHSKRAVLLALLWISLFGLSECALRNVDAKYHVHFYALLFVAVLVYLYFASMSFCSLM
jgi:hypothetical protein